MGVESKPRLLDQLRTEIRLRHYSPRTEEAYTGWVRRFILFHGKRHPKEMVEPKCGNSLFYLAEKLNVGAVAQNQALNALVFLYRNVLQIDFDVSDLPTGRTVTKEFLQSKPIKPGDIVLIYTGYAAPESPDEYPQVITLTRDAAEYLGDIPIRAFATDSFTVGVSPGDRPAIPSPDPLDLIPVHHAFLSRGIPIYEQLMNVSELLSKERMLFVGVPLNIQNGDGMNVRPIVMVY